MQKKLLIFILLTFCGLLGNIFNIEMFFGVNQIFGSIFVLLAVWFFGPWLGLVCALIVHSYTIFLWGHPYAFLSFGLEAIVVGILMRRGIPNLFVADTIYWLVIGIWLVPLFYGQIMGLPEPQITLIMLKQPANGILNALFASLLGLLIIHFRIIEDNRLGQINLHNLLFTLIMTCVVLALYTAANLISQNTFKRFQNSITDNLEQSGQYIQLELFGFIKQYSDEITKFSTLSAKLKKPLLLEPDNKMLALWRQQNGQYQLLASKPGQVNSERLPAEGLACQAQVFLIFQKNQSYMTLATDRGCTIAVYSPNLLQAFLDEQVYLPDLDVLVEQDGVMVASSSAGNGKNYATGSPLISESRKKYQKIPVQENIYHQLPAQNMPKMVKWKKSNYLYELPKNQTYVGKITLKQSFSPYIDSLQQIYIFTFSVMAMVILLTALISYLISKSLVQSLDKLAQVTANLPSKLLQGQTILWPKSRIKEFSSLSHNFSLLTEVLKNIFQESDLRYRKLFEASKDAILVLELPDMKVIEHNPMARKLFDTHLLEQKSLAITQLIPELDTSIFDCKQSTNEKVYWLSCQHSKRVPIRLNAQYLNLKTKNVILLDIQDLSAEVQHKEQLNLIAKVFENTSEGIMITDENSNIIKVNQGFSIITGYDAKDAIGNKPSKLQSGWQDKEFYQNMWDVINNEGKWEGEIWNRRKTGELYAEWLSVYRVVDESGRVSNYIGVFIDITEKKQVQEKINQLAYFDVLTGLPNRQLFSDRIEHALNKAKRNKSSVALLFFDLDNFKTVNDSLGHHAGDQLLKQVSQRVGAVIRDCDTFARLGGDEFTIILEDINNKDNVVSIAEKVLHTLSLPFSIAGKEVYSSASIGACIYPDDAKSIQQMMQYADTAMYRAKEKGKKGLEFYTSEMNEETLRHMEIEVGLRKAIAQDQLQLYYQPQVNIDDNHLFGVEALVRWIDPDKGFISPGVFIPIAEGSDLMGLIEAWVVKTAAKQLKTWHEMGINITMSINISDYAFRKTDFVQNTIAVIQAQGIDCHHFDLELTERIVMDTSESYLKIGQLKEAGFKLSLDDFGTGQSSLSYLKRYNIDKLKIDKSFVDDIPHDKQSCEIANAIVSLAAAMNMSTVAEGIERKEQMDYFSQLGCNAYQGYLYSKPLPAEQFERFYRSLYPSYLEMRDSELS